jgi:hypothetical protein
MTPYGRNDKGLRLGTRGRAGVGGDGRANVCQEFARENADTFRQLSTESAQRQIVTDCDGVSQGSP